MGMFTSGAYDSFKNRQQEHRKNRAGARKDYNDWLTSQRDAGIDVTSEMATNQFANIADNDYNIMTGAPTKMEMGAQLSANNTAARDTRRNAEVSRFEVMKNRDDIFQSALTNSFLTNDDSIQAVEAGRKSLGNNPELVSAYDDYVSSIDVGNNRKSWLSEYMNTSEVQSTITSLVDQGITDYSKFNPNAAPDIASKFNEILERKGNERFRATGTSIYTNAVAAGGVVDEATLRSQMEDANIPKDFQDTIILQMNGHNNTVNDKTATSLITALLSNITTIDEATFNAQTKGASETVTANLRQLVNSHNKTVQNTADQKVADKVDAVLTMNNKDTEAVMSDTTLSPDERIAAIVELAGNDPTKDDVTLQRIKRWVDITHSRQELSFQQVHQQAQVAASATASTNSTTAQREGDEEVDKIAASLLAAKTNSTQSGIINQVAAALEPYYIGKKNARGIQNIKLVIQNGIDNGLGVDQIVQAASAYMTLDSSNKSAIEREAQLTAGSPMPVSNFMSLWGKALSQASTTDVMVKSLADDAIRIDTTSGALLDANNVITDNYLDAMSAIPQAIAALRGHIQAANDDYNELNTDHKKTGLFYNSYKIKEHQGDIDSYLQTLKNIQQQAENLLNKLLAKENQLREATKIPAVRDAVLVHMQQKAPISSGQGSIQSWANSPLYQQP